MHCSLRPPQQMRRVCVCDREIASALPNPALLFLAKQHNSVCICSIVSTGHLQYIMKKIKLFCGAVIYQTLRGAVALSQTTWYCSAPMTPTGETAPHYFPLIAQLSLWSLCTIRAAERSQNVKAALCLDVIKYAIPFLTQLYLSPISTIHFTVYRYI